MKFAHIADLHLGKRVHNFSMLEEQKYILKEMLEIFRKEQIDGVLIAGDVYDKTVPCAEAVQLFDSFLTSLAKEKISVYMISGNHDCAQRLSFGASLLINSDVYITKAYDGNIRKITAEDRFGRIHIYLLPFIKPAQVRYALQTEEIATSQEAVKAVLKEIQTEEKERNILVAHQFVTGALKSDSEEVFVGGTDQVDGALFDRFDYVALGHIHRAQKVGRETLRYSGTPMKYSFSEADQKKSVTIVECLEKGNIQIYTVPLLPKHDMRKIKGTYMEVTSAKAYTQENRKDYIQVTLTEEEDIPQAMEKLRCVYPNLMRLEYDNKRTRQNQQIQTVQQQENKSELELFEEFYKLVNNETMRAEQEAFCEKLIRKLKEEGI